MLNRHYMKFAGILVAMIFVLVIGGCGSTNKDEVDASIKSEINNVKEYLFPVQQGSKYGFINQRGEMIIEPEYTFAKQFSEGLAEVWVGDFFTAKLGFINEEGEMVIEPQYELVKEFSEGLAAFSHSKSGPWGYIDKNGEVVMEAIYSRPQPFSEGYTLVGLGYFGSRRRFVDRNGNVLANKEFDDARSFAEDLAPVEIDGMWGYINKEAEMVIVPRFNDAWSFSDGLAAVQVKNKYGFIDKTGELVIKPKFSDAGVFSEGLCVAQNKLKYGFIDKSGHWVIKPKFIMAGEFNNGLALVTIMNISLKILWDRGDFMKSGYINKQGKFIWGPNASEIPEGFEAGWEERSKK